MSGVCRQFPAFEGAKLELLYNALCNYGLVLAAPGLVVPAKIR